MHRTIPSLIALLLLLVYSTATRAEEGGSPGPSTGSEIQVDEAGTPEDDKSRIITVDHDAGRIDLKAKMVTQKPEWLELIATTAGPKGREHEAIVTIDTKPSQIHLALVTLGLEPGHPLKNTLEGEQVHSEPATGPAVELFFVYEKDGQPHEVPVHTWVVDAKTSEPIPPCRWLFTGSVFRKWEGKAYYMADEAGTIASLVHFGDDLIARRTDTTKDTDFQQLQLSPDLPIALGDDLVLRIRVPEPQSKDDSQPAESPSLTPDPAETTPETSDNPTPDEP